MKDDTSFYDEILDGDIDYEMDNLRDKDAHDEQYENRLEELMAEEGCDDEDEYKEIIRRDKMSGYDLVKEYAIDRLIDNYGIDFPTYVYENNLLDIDAYADYLVDKEGVAYHISNYDEDETILMHGGLAYRYN